MTMTSEILFLRLFIFVFGLQIKGQTKKKIETAFFGWVCLGMFKQL